MAAACLVFIMSGIWNTVGALTEIAEQFSIRRKEVARAYRTLFRELGFTVSIADPIKSITKIASKIGIK